MKGHFSVHQLALHLGVSDRSIERWYAKGKIPEPASRNDHGWKFWSTKQVRTILEWHLRTKPKPKSQ